jgi:hypothetical protein
MSQIQRRATTIRRYLRKDSDTEFPLATTPPRDAAPGLPGVLGNRDSPSRVASSAHDNHLLARAGQDAQSLGLASLQSSGGLPRQTCEARNSLARIMINDTVVKLDICEETASIAFQEYLKKVKPLVPSPLMGEGQGGGEVTCRLDCFIPPPPSPLPPGEGEFKGPGFMKASYGT